MRAPSLRRSAVLAALLAAALAAPARAQIGLDLSEPPPKAAKKKPPAKKKKAPPPAPAPEAPPAAAAPEQPPPPRAEPEPERPPERRAQPARPRQELPGLDLAPADPAAKERLAAAKRLLDDGRNETAALAFDAILAEPGLAAVHGEARYQLGKSLARLGLHHAALTVFDEVLAQGPQGRFYGSALEWLFFVGNKLANEQPLLSRVAAHAGDAFPPGHEDRFNFLLSKYAFERGRALGEAGRPDEARGAFAEAQRLASLVREQPPAPPPGGELPPSSSGDLFAKARFVSGLVRYAQGDAQGASDAFKDVVRITNPKRGRPADPQLRELAFLQLARIHYEARQNRYAIFYYGKMPWGGESWLEGLWEAAYAHYRIGDYEKSLGNLLTLQSPYFKDEYYPESYVLKAIVYYENCRYPEARLVLETFSSLFEPVYDELSRTTATPEAPQAYFELLAAAGSGPRAMTPKVRKLTLTDQNIRRLDESIRELEHEVDDKLGGLSEAFRASPLARRLQHRLAAQRTAMVEEAGARARAKLEYERDQLRALLAQALRIQIEVSRKEREALEGSLALGSQVEVVRDLKYSTAVSDEHLYWPYEGEFWRDELGTYSYTLTKGCKDRLTRAAAPSASRAP